MYGPVNFSSPIKPASLNPPTDRQNWPPELRFSIRGLATPPGFLPKPFLAASIKAKQVGAG